MIDVDMDTCQKLFVANNNTTIKLQAAANNIKKEILFFLPCADCCEISSRIKDILTYTNEVEINYYN